MTTALLTPAPYAQRESAQPILPAYVGNAAYCYANTTSMLLASAGESVSPSLIEVLSGVGLGALWIPDERAIIFGAVVPDIGVSKALDLLGFTCHERSFPDDAPLPLAELRRALETGPVAIGPVDIGCLTYTPRARGPNGGDHFVLVYAADDTQVYLHDPAGFPHVSLPLDDLERAWRGEEIGYKRGSFRHWHAPRRREPVSADQLFDRALAWFAEIYAGAGTDANRRGWLTGPAAVRAHVAELRAGRLSPEQTGHLTAFAYRLGARRALDYAAYFQDRRPDLAALKRRQAERFGSAHTLAVRQDWQPLAEVVEEIAELEGQLEEAFH